MRHCRVLALDVRSQSLGFAVLEEPRILLDFGRKPYRVSGIRDATTIVQEKVVTLLNFFMPSAIILKNERGRNGRRLLARKRTVEAIKSEMLVRSVEVIFLRRKQVHRAFRQSDYCNKYTIAGLIAETFPELAWKLPKTRKNWQPEHHNMTIFDAISLGLAYFSLAQNFSQGEGREPPAQQGG